MIKNDAMDQAKGQLVDLITWALSVIDNIESIQKDSDSKFELPMVKSGEQKH